MKSIAFIISLLLVFSSLNAQRRVALHHAGTTQIFGGNNPLIDAYNAAVSGDTIYIPGGSFVAPSTLNKPNLTLIGAGYHPDSTQATYPTVISNGIVLEENADNLFIEGIEFFSNIQTATNKSVNDLTLKRCKFNGELLFFGNLSSPCLSAAIAECIFISNVNFENLSNSLITNSIFQSKLYHSSNNLFKNNIFLNDSPWNVLNYFQNNTIANNIFTSQYYTEIDGYGNIVQNNLFVRNSPGYGSAPIVSGNYTSVSATSIFVNVPNPHNTFSFSYDYHLQNPTTYLGNDGTQVGIYGGMFPFKAGSVPVNPHISFQLVAPQTLPNGDLPIQFRVNAQNH